MRSVALLFVTGCMAGGGPILGYGERGVVYGAEANGGFTFANLAVGAQHDQQTLVYAAVSGDAALDSNALDMLPGRHEYGRLGGGVGVSSTTGRDGYDTYDAHGVFLTGLGFSLPVPGHEKSCASSVGEFVAVTVELRYVAQWEVVLVPRLEAYETMCY